ncbi:hypothetical protein [Shouchella clausii]|uniref:hypothetical protein n=1 Tax=Shouchella clausii TaxID=79880 RepID=UPI000BA6AC28|nr:hypothetical protein [Shouchella clausii]PAD91602.1 hypothetical protein CHH52_13315 [Shouchella clausii]GIN10232.1 hypothetical protein J26TS2_00990 [Shouchella clausii]
MIKGLDVAVSEFNQHEGNAVIFADLEANEVWCDVLEIPSYHDDSVVALVGKNNLDTKFDKYRSETLEKLIAAKRTMYNEGFSKMQIEDDYNFAEILYYA